MTTDVRVGRAVAVAAAVLGTACIVGTYSRLSYTWDEPPHVAAGLEVFQDGRYTFQTENPLLSRLTIALWPWLAGATLHDPGAPITQGPVAAADRVFHRSSDHVRNTTQARVGNLPWFWACLFLTWMLAGGRNAPLEAALATSAVATAPLIVGHAGFATTDVPFVTAFLAALVGLRRLLFRPDVAGALWFGVAMGAAVATKFSTLVFLPPVAAALIVATRKEEQGPWLRALMHARLWRLLAIVVLSAAVTIWAAYGFRVGRMVDLPRSLIPFGTFPDSGWIARVGQWRIPAHEFFHGLVYLRTHTIAGHRAMLLGDFSQRGFWLYYPVVLSTKTPLPFLVFALVGFFGLWRRRAEVRVAWAFGLATGAVALLGVAMTSPINIGSRHVIVLLPIVALAASAGWRHWMSASPRSSMRWFPFGLIAAQAALLVASFPHQSAYFNVLGRREPGYISSDSDFDWGQDVLMLASYLKAHPVDALQVQINGSHDLCRFDLPPIEPLTTSPRPGWIAVSERSYRVNRGGRALPCGPTNVSLNAPPGWLDWLHARTPDAIVGKTIRLYHVTAAELPTPASTSRGPGEK